MKTTKCIADEWATGWSGQQTGRSYKEAVDGDDVIVVVNDDDDDADDDDCG